MEKQLVVVDWFLASASTPDALSEIVGKEIEDGAELHGDPFYGGSKFCQGLVYKDYEDEADLELIVKGLPPENESKLVEVGSGEGDEFKEPHVA